MRDELARFKSPYTVAYWHVMARHGTSWIERGAAIL